MILLILLLTSADVQRLDLERFPELEQCSHALAFNRAYRETLLGQLRCAWHHEPTIRVALEETDWLYETWCCLWRAQVYREWDYGVENLRALRQRLGPGAYCGGLMPPCVPLWRFHKIDLVTR